VRVLVNGEAREVAAGTTVATLVDDLAGGRSGIAVAVDDAVVRRSAWGDTALTEGARVEVLTAVQGG